MAEKPPSKVTEEGDLFVDEEGKSVFRDNPETGEREIYRKWGDEWHGPYGPGADSDDESDDDEVPEE